MKENFRSSFPNYHKGKTHFINSLKLVSITGLLATTLVSPHLKPILHQQPKILQNHNQITLTSTQNLL